MTSETTTDSGKALQILKDGNEKFCKTDKNSACWSAEERKALVKNGQHPFACVVCCSDSRVIPENIFSVGFGEIFTIRNAGNVIGLHEMASVEYAVLHLNVKLVVVMGHTHCGAVAAAIENRADGTIKGVTDKILEGLTDLHNTEKCEKENAENGVKELLKSAPLRDLAEAKKIKIVSALYDTETGKVNFLV